MAFHDRPYYGGPQRGGFGGGGGGGFGGFRILMPQRGSYTLVLLLITLAVFILQLFLDPGQGGRDPLEKWGNFNFAQAIAGLQLWRIITYQFLHADFGHIFGNMLWLFFFGPMVEQFLGSKRFLAFYLLCGVGGALLYMVLMGLTAAFGDTGLPFLTVQRDLPMIGASACTFGILVAMLRIAPHQKVLLFFAIPVKLWIIAVFALVFEVYTVMFGVGDNVGGSAAHLGGAAVGWLLITQSHLLNFFERLTFASPKEAIAERVEQSRAKRTEAQEAEIDRILAKVSDHGLQSLTEKEKRTLQQATEDKRAG